jgi:hypothetical protein
MGSRSSSSVGYRITDLRPRLNIMKWYFCDVIYTVGSGSDGGELSGGRSSVIGGGTTLHAVARTVHRQCEAPPALWCTTRDGKTLNQWKWHDEPHIGLILAQVVATRARRNGAAFSDLNIDGGSLRRSPDSRNRSQGFTVRSSSSYAPIAVRNYESRVYRGIMMLGFFVLMLKIGINLGLSIGVSGMDM